MWSENQMTKAKKQLFLLVFWNLTFSALTHDIFYGNKISNDFIALKNLTLNKSSQVIIESDTFLVFKEHKKLFRITDLGLYGSNIQTKLIDAISDS